MEEAIREATLLDVPRIVELGRKFLADGPYKDQVDNPEQAMRFACSLVDNPKAAVLVAEQAARVVGVLAFIIYPHYFTGQLTANEMIWYIEPEARKGGIGMRLMWAGERLAKAMGAIRMQFTAPTAEVGKLYERFCGYHQIEVGYEKVL
jgi:GNAT superfamily N-acetyltransferase